MNAVAKQKTPRSDLRAAIFASVGQPSVPALNLWLVRSERCNKRWVLTSDLHLLYFLYLEFAPGVVTVDMCPAPVTTELGGFTAPTQFRAVVRYDDGHVECVAFGGADPAESETDKRIDVHRRAAAAVLQGKLVVVTAESLKKVRFRILNGMRMLRFMNAARGRSLAIVRNCVNSLVRARRVVTLSTLLLELNDHGPALVLAACFQLYQKGRLQISIGEQPLSLSTEVRSPS